MQISGQGVLGMKNNYKSIFFFFLGLASLYLWSNVIKQKKMPNIRDWASYFVPLNIKGYSAGRIPYFEARIEDKSIKVKLDLGYQGNLSLPAEFIQQLTAKILVGSTLSGGMKGRTYENDVYHMPSVDIGPICFFPVLADETNLEFNEDIELGTKDENAKDDPVAILGWRTFNSFNFLVDCIHQSLILCDSLQTLKQHGYPTEFFTESPLLLDRGSLDFEVMTSMGKLRCVLDTGCTFNFLNKDEDDTHRVLKHGDIDLLHHFNPENEDLMSFDLDKECKLTNFQIGDKDFGPMSFLRIKSPLDIDAFIGMEFFKETVVFFDIENRKVYFWEPLDSKAKKAKSCLDCHEN